MPEKETRVFLPQNTGFRPCPRWTRFCLSLKTKMAPSAVFRLRVRRRVGPIKSLTRSVGRIHFKTILSEIQVVDIIAADPVEYLTWRLRVFPKPRQRSLILGIRRC